MYTISNRETYGIQFNDGIHTDIRVPVRVYGMWGYPSDKYPVDSWEVWISQTMEQKHNGEVEVTLNNNGFIVPYEFSEREIKVLQAFVKIANITEILWEGANA